jgi:glycosyltransferase involved in cell wall biosynthesis
MKDLSIIIASRNEMFLQRTVEDVLANIEADTEIIVICDGAWPDPPVMNHPKVTVVFHDVSIGQRAATNEGVRMSQAKYIMKVDAHCAFGKGFDRILIEDCRRNWTMIPMQYALYAFDWKCLGCGDKTGQGTQPTSCKKCQSTEFEMEIVWKPRERKVTYSWRFDNDMRFQYWKRHKDRPECKRDLMESMSCIGAFFLMRRDRFNEIGGLDEKHGSYGQYGTEIACKTWLSGGRLITSKKTWYAHMFRTGNFKGAFKEGNTWPYPIDQRQVEHARQYSKDFWLNDRWTKAKYPLSWLTDRFSPVPDWHEGAK